MFKMLSKTWHVELHQGVPRRRHWVMGGGGVMKRVDFI